jgi:nitric oxide reductase large subunit
VYVNLCVCESVCVLSQLAFYERHSSAIEFAYVAANLELFLSILPCLHHRYVLGVPFADGITNAEVVRSSTGACTCSH